MILQTYTLTELLLIGHFVLNIFFAMRVIYSKHSSSVALAWLVILFVVPYLGTMAYILVGEPRLSNKRGKRVTEINAFYDKFSQKYLSLIPSHQTTIDPRFQGLSQLAQQNIGFGLGAGNDGQLLSDTDAMLHSFLQDIALAEETCLLMFYIIDAQGRIIEVLEAIMAAASRGVKCRIMVDDIGSRTFINSEWPQRLRVCGVEVTCSLPVGLFKTFFMRNDLRNHRKLLIIDHKVAYTGSYNLVDPHFFKQDSGVGEWIDVMMRCEGIIARLLSVVFYADWAVENDDNLRETLEYLQAYLEKKTPQELLAEYTVKGDSGSVLQVIPSAPDQKSSIVYETILCALHSALDKVVITTPYFVPDEMLLTALITTARKGVKVIIILPKKIDSWLTSHASRAYYQALLEAGVELAMFNGGLLHSKTIVIDEQYALFGTVNMDMRSFYLNMEVSLAVYDLATVKAIAKLQQSYLQQCEEVDLAMWQKRPKISRFIERCVRLLSPLL